MKALKTPDCKLRPNYCPNYHKKFWFIAKLAIVRVNSIDFAKIEDQRKRDFSFRMNIRAFLSAYKKSMIVLLTPVIFIALLFKDEMNSLSEEDLCKLFGQENEDCKMTMNRLRIPGQEPVLFKVF